MTAGDKKRQRIFEIYRDNLNLLIDNGFIKGKKDFYLCPLCLKRHSKIDEIDPLTLEDAPPKSLGGKANILTCKSCNNTMGKTVDFHLAERLRELDSANFLPGTETPVQVKTGGKTLQATLTITEAGKMQLMHSKKNNNPVVLEEIMKDFPGSTVNMNFLRTRVINDNLELALLKAGYLLAFQKFGYSLILHDCYKIVRDQLKNPEQRIYPLGFWIEPTFPKEYSGVYFVRDKGLECILSMFTVKTGKSERFYGVILPFPIHPIEELVSNFQEQLNAEEEFAINIYPSPKDQAKMNYLYNKASIMQMYNWMVGKE